MGRGAESFLSADMKNFLFSVCRQGMKDNTFTTASSMVYSTLMALVPGFAFVYSFFGAFGVLQDFIDQLSLWFSQVFGASAGQQMLSLLEKYTENAMSLGVIGLLSFLVTMVLLINKIWTQVNRIYHVSVERNMMKRIVGIVSFLLVTVLLAAAYIAVQGKLNTWYNKLLGIQIVGWSKVIGIVTPHLINFIALFLICLFVPNVKVNPRGAAYGALGGTGALFITSWIFSSVSSIVSRYSLIYGSMAVLFLFLFRMYIFWVITFWVVEYCYVYQFRPDLQKFRGLPQSPAIQLAEGVNIIMLIGSNFRDGKGATGTGEMVSRLVISEYRLSGYLDLLTDLKFIIPANGNHSEYVVARPLDSLKVRDLVSSLYGLEGVCRDVHDTAGEAVAIQVKEHGVDSLGSLTIENLLERI